MNEPSEVYVWRSHLDQPPEQVDALAALLSPDEWQRAQRYRRVIDQQHFIVARGRLRQILASYLAIAPEAVQFSYGDRGKPALQDHSLSFNVSHSGGLALYVVSQPYGKNNTVRRVGIDVEQVRPIPDVTQLARRFFSAGEYEALMELPSDRQLMAFFRGWTAKEAYLKALGVGIGQLEQVEVAFTIEPIGLLRVPEPEQLSHWSLQLLPVAEGYVAALAVEGSDWTLLPPVNFPVMV